MEPVSAGAGLLTLITFTLQSTKVLYEVVSGIRNGPRKVQRLASDIHRLQSVLTQFSNCPAVRLAPSEIDLKVIEDCSEDVSRYEKVLQKIQISTEDKRTGKAWKKIKAILKKQDLQDISAQMNYHLTELSLQLNIMQL